MADTRTDLKDWTYIVCTIIQTFFIIVGFFLVNFWVRRRERKEARRQADADKIAGILSQKYDEVENIFCIFKKKVDKLKKKIIVGEFSEFDVLLYMCHPDNKQRFTDLDVNCSSIKDSNDTNDTNDSLDGILSDTNDTNDSLDGILSDVQKIMKLFFEFRIQLPSIQYKECPQEVKDEFSIDINEMGKTIYPFVSSTRQKVIKVVLKYFGCSDSSQDLSCCGCSDSSQDLPCCLPCCLVCRSGNDQVSRSTPPTASYQLVPGNQEANQTLKPYPGHGKIVGAIPYLSFLRYKNDEIVFTTPIGIASCIGDLETCLRNEKLQKPVREGILAKIEDLWTQYSGLKVENLLHLIRMIMFEQSKNAVEQSKNAVEQESKLCQFVKYVDEELNSPSRTNPEIAEYQFDRALCKMKSSIKHLSEPTAVHRHFLENEKDCEELLLHVSNMEEFIARTRDNSAPV